MDFNLDLTVSIHHSPERTILVCVVTFSYCISQSISAPVITSEGWKTSRRLLLMRGKSLYLHLSFTWMFHMFEKWQTLLRYLSDYHIQGLVNYLKRQNCYNMTFKVCAVAMLRNIIYKACEEGEGSFTLLI